MRKELLILLAAWHLAVIPAVAQDPPTKPAPLDVPSTGLFDIGLRGGNENGDAARFERYRDLRPGAATVWRMDKRTDRYLFGAEVFNAGYRDQRYAAALNTGRLQLSAYFTGVPLNYLYDAPLAWTSDGRGRFTLDPALRLAVQGPTNATNDGTAVGVPCAPGAPPATCNATTAPAALATRSVYNDFLVRDDIRVRRDTLGGKFSYDITPTVVVDLDASTMKRTGTMPWAASFAFNNVNELPVPIDQRTNELRAGTEWTGRRGLIRAEYWGSFFSNDVQTLTWDNPIRATDFNNGLTPPSGPFDASGYSNGNGPAQGQAALWPGNSLNAFSLTGLYKALPRTTVNGSVQLTYMRQNEALLPWTINSSINNDAVLALYPGLRSLPRSTAQAEVNGLNGLVTANSRLTRNLTLAARYRYNKHHNQTPSFDGRTYVRFDSAPGVFTDDPLTPHVEGWSEYFQIDRHNADVNATLNLHAWGSVRAGYGNERIERHGRGFSDVNEHTLRLSYDAMLIDRVSIRASLDQGRRRGDGYILAGVDYEQGPAGTQPGLRYYDEANRDRSRGAVVLTVNPIDMLGVFAQFSTTRDTFLPDGSIPAGREQFGLISQDINAVAVGVDITPGETLHLGASYGYDRFSALQKSRNANPPPDPTWVDPARNWTLDNAELVRTFLAYADLDALLDGRASMRLGFERSDADNAYTYGGPRIAVLQAAGQFVPLPNVTNDWNRFNADFRYFLTRTVGLGLGYQFEQLHVADWNTIDTNGPVVFSAATGVPRIDYFGALTTGYGNRPYRANRVFARLLYRF